MVGQVGHPPAITSASLRYSSSIQPGAIASAIYAADNAVLTGVSAARILGASTVDSAAVRIQLLSSPDRIVWPL
jgi:hypothetical protein